MVGYDGAWNVRDEECSVWQTKPEREQKEETKQSRWGFRGKTVWNWLELFIVPIVLVGIGLLFEMQQADRQEAMETQQQELAEQRAQDEALQAYLNQMSSLLLEKDLRTSKEDGEVRTLARARTLTVLGRLDRSGKTALMQFLVEARLVQRVDGRDPIISLRVADLREADLFDANLSGANLFHANLSDADLRQANLSDANLFNANLSGAVLIEADLSEANLSIADLSHAALLHANLLYADLRGANLNGADLFIADLSDADLSHAALRQADLRQANLSNANLSDAEGWTEKQLMAARSLEGATMPNGQKYEDWRKDR